MYRTDRQPLGRPTRGKTAPGRLRRVDRLLELLCEPLIRRWEGWEQAAFVDLGYGATPTTTLESAARLRRLQPRLLVIGVELDPERVARALPHADARTRFRRGGFELPLAADESARVIRALNVLRQYDEGAVADAHALLLRRLRPGGLLIEGTSTPSGDRMVLNLLRPTHPTEVLFSVNPRRPPTDPRELQAVLPKDHIHRVRPGEPIHALMEAWERAWALAQPASVFGPLAVWCDAGRRLMAERPDVVCRPALLRRGMILWRPDRTLR